MKETSEVEKNDLEKYEDFLPTIRLDPEIVEVALNEMESEVPDFDSFLSLKDVRKGEPGFELDKEKDLGSEITGVEIISCTPYWGKYNGKTFDKLPITAEPDKELGFEKRAELVVRFLGQEMVMDLPPSATRNFISFRKRWRARGTDVIGGLVNIRSVIKTGKQGPMNLPIFELVNPPAQAPQEPKEPKQDKEDDIPW